MDKPKTLAGANIDKEPITVNHGELRDATNDSIYKKECPSCEIGWLLVSREYNPPHKIKANDYCLYCGQRFIYADVDLIESEGRINRKTK